MHLHCHLPFQYTFSQYLHPLQSTTFRLLLPTFLLHLKAINRTPLYSIVENFVDNYIFFVENLWISGQNRKIIYLVFLYNITHLSQSISQDDLPFGQFIFPIYFYTKGEMKLLFEHFISYRAETSKFNYSKLKIKNQFFKCSFAITVNYFTSYNNS